jgi:hypothetical protein
MSLGFLLRRVHAATRTFAAPRATIDPASLWEEDDPIWHFLAYIMVTPSSEGALFVLLYEPTVLVPVLQSGLS